MVSLTCIYGEWWWVLSWQAVQPSSRVETYLHLQMPFRVFFFFLNAPSPESHGFSHHWMTESSPHSLESQSTAWVTACSPHSHSHTVQIHLCKYCTAPIPRPRPRPRCVQWDTVWVCKSFKPQLHHTLNSRVCRWSDPTAQYKCHQRHCLHELHCLHHGCF